MIRILAMSDSHRKQSRFTLPPADLFVHAGDFSNFGSGVEEFALWYWQLPYKHKLIVLGNHEERDAVEKRPVDVWRKLFGPTMLHNEACEIDFDGRTIVVYGAPYGATAFAGAPASPQLVLTHEPPLGILDRRVGSEEVASFVRRSQPLLHVFGHVHEQGGRVTDEGGTLYTNAATRAMLIDLGESATLAKVIFPRVSKAF
jgi:hypothetical protein